MFKKYKSLLVVASLLTVFSTTADAGRVFNVIKLKNGASCQSTGHVWLTRNRAYGQHHVNCSRPGNLLSVLIWLRKQGDFRSTRGYANQLETNIGAMKEMRTTSSVQCIGNRRSLWGMAKYALILDSNNGRTTDGNNRDWRSVNSLNCS